MAYERALAVKPDLAEAHQNVALLYEKVGDISSAERHHLLAVSSSSSIPFKTGMYWQDVTPNFLPGPVTPYPKLHPGPVATEPKLPPQAS